VEEEEGIEEAGQAHREEGQGHQEPDVVVTSSGIEVSSTSTEPVLIAEDGQKALDSLIPGRDLPSVDGHVKEGNPVQGALVLDSSPPVQAEEPYLESSPESLRRKAAEPITDEEEAYYAKFFVR